MTLSLKKYYNSTKVIPANGGEYIEGIVAESTNDVQPVVKKLTNIGLVGFNEQGEIIPKLAQSWEIVDDQKTYVFHLVDGVKASNLSEIIRREKPGWSNIDIETPDDKTIKFKLKQPFSPFLSNLVEPLFPMGYYVVDKESKTQINLKKRDNSPSGQEKPYIDKITLKLYPDYSNMLKALKSKDIDGVNLVKNNEDIPNSFNIYEIKLPRYSVLFFNLNNPIWKKEIRQKLAKNQSVGENFKVTLVASDKQVNIDKATEIQNNWKKLGVELEIKNYDQYTLQNEIIPKRQYDILLYGLDYGSDPDIYPFWHSSQIGETGLNLSNFSNVDADKLLEQARLTTNMDERNKKYQDFQKIFDDEVPAIILEQDSLHYAISKQIKGITTDFKAFASADRYFNVNKWYIKEKRIKK